MRCTWFLLLFVGTLAAQDCPVKMSDLNLYFSTRGDRMHVKIANTGSKTLTAVALGIIWYDVTQLPRESPQLFERKMSLKTGKDLTFRYYGEIFSPYGDRQGGAKIYLARAVFDDGSIWQDNGDHKCYVPDYLQEKFEATKKAGN